jgi:hypothetical protein
MLVTPIAAEKISGEGSGIIPSQWMFPATFRRFAGPPPSVFLLPADASIGVETDWVRDANGVQLRRYDLANDKGARGIQTAYMDRYSEYRGEFDMGLVPPTILAGANKVYEKWGMGELKIHLMTNPNAAAVASWENAPTISKSVSEFSAEFISWAELNRPETLLDPFGAGNPVTALLYPDKMVVQWQEAAIQSGLVIQESLLHPGVPPTLRALNDKALAAQRKKLEQQLKDALAAA